MGNIHVAVIGAGAFGGWTAYQLLQKGAKVTLFDTWGPGHSRASSGGETRLIRGIYGEDEIYTDLVAKAFSHWNRFQQDTSKQVYFKTGSVWFFSKEDDSYARNALPLITQHGLFAEEWSLSTLQQKFPQINADGLRTAFWEEEAGYLLAREACQAVVEAFVRQGGKFKRMAAFPAETKGDEMPYLALGNGEKYFADAYIFACGPWLPNLFPSLLKELVSVTRQEIFYFGTPNKGASFRVPDFPVWVEMGERVHYGVPDYNGRGFKLADDTREGPMDPTHGDRSPTPRKIEEARAFLAHRFPLLKGAPLIESRTCQYTNSPNGHYILDRHPKAINVWLAGAGCGHGYKLGPSIGTLMADHILEGTSIPSIFSLEQAQKEEWKTNQFEH
ncbi:MAG: FAD-dependent oxidoreductase [Saprospiraceae bacterium]